MSNVKYPMSNISSIKCLAFSGKKKNTLRSQAGFTFMELVLVMGIILILLGFVGINFAKFQHLNSIDATVDSLTADMTSFQTKAMVGESDSSINHDNYGIYFEPDRYILFHGSTFSSTDPTNFTVMLDTPIEFSASSFPNNTLIFSALSGEVANFANGQNTITIRNTVGGEQKTISVNRYGVITGIN